MCEHCEETKQELMREIRELAAHEGELYAELEKAAIETYNDPGERKQALDTVVLEAIAARCADAASYTTDGEFHQTPAPLILGIWAGNYMGASLDHMREKMMRNRLGMGEN